jgi:hypothetical protein
VDFASLTLEEVNARCVPIEERLKEEARRRGSAATVSGTEDDDWLKLRALMQITGARTNRRPTWFGR